MSDGRARRREGVGWTAFVLLAIIAWAGVVDAAPTRPILSDAQVGEAEAATRLTFEIDRRVGFKVFTLDNPDRVVIDLDEVHWRAGDSANAMNSGLVQRLRHAVNRPGTTRIVIDCRVPAKVHRAALTASDSGGHRLVVDLVARSQPVAKRKDASRKAPPALRRASLRWAPSPPPRKPPVPREYYVVVLDPGHGGADTGAISASGALEKVITLTAARHVSDQLRRLGRYKVILTRYGDEFIKLRRRVAIARAAKADLFVSLHADANPIASVRGASVYTLSENASDAEAEALAERENKADLIAGVDLSHQEPEVANILISLAQRETLNESARLATLLVKELGRQTRTLRNTHRFAGFAVLKAPDIPSVLVELGYLSNRKDEGLLQRDDHMTKLAIAIARAIDAYFNAVADLARR